jgi:type II secretory pathway component PulK
MKNVVFTNTSGAVLLVVLWVVALLALVAGALLTRTQLAIRQHKAAIAESEANSLLDALGTLAIRLLQEDADTDMDAFLESWGRLYRANASELMSVQAGAGASAGFSLRIVPSDETGKVNVNLASVELLTAILREAGAEADAAEIALAIVDWRDPDAIGVAEGDVYSSYDLPYSPSDSDLLRIEELLFVRGITPELFFGEDANHNGTLDPNEDDDDAFLPADNADGRLQLGLLDLLTVYGEGSVNVNTAPESVLRALFSTAMADEFTTNHLMTTLLSHRRGADGADGTDDDKPFASFEELVAFGALTLGDEDGVRASNLLRNLDVAGHAFRFCLTVQMYEPRLVTEAEMVVLREDGQITVVEWNQNN